MTPDELAIFGTIMLLVWSPSKTVEILPPFRLYLQRTPRPANGLRGSHCGAAAFGGLSCG